MRVIATPSRQQRHTPLLCMAHWRHVAQQTCFETGDCDMRRGLRTPAAVHPQTATAAGAGARSLSPRVWGKTQETNGALRHAQRCVPSCQARWGLRLRTPALHPAVRAGAVRLNTVGLQTRARPCSSKKPTSLRVVCTGKDMCVVVAP